MFFLIYDCSLPCGSEANVPFCFYNSLLLSFLFLFILVKPFLGLVLVEMGCTLWGNTGCIISLHGMKYLRCLYDLPISNNPPNLSIKYVHPLKCSKNIFPHPVIFLK